MKSEEIDHSNPVRFCHSWKEIWWNVVINIKNRRVYLLMFGCTGLLMLSYFVLYSDANYSNSWSSPFYFGTNDSQTESLVDSRPELETTYSFSSDENKAFFLETAGNETLNIRQACAVESLALHNPSVTAYVLFGQERFNSSSITLKTLTENYKNIRVIGLNMDSYLAGSPLEHWYKFTDWRNGPYHVAHFSDGLRLLTLSRYGGYYFDLDIIHVRPVTYYRNFIGTEDGGTASNSVIHSDYGYPVLQMAINDFPVDYRADAWTHNGPALLNRVLTKWCGVDSLAEMNYLKCRGFSVLPNTSFYPVHYSNWQEFFKQRDSNDKMNPDWLTTEVLGVHIWNKLSYGEPVFRNSTQYYTQLARIHCPATFAIAPDVF
ncbi:lactosylceramide 4-alpha-galactosyltransferase-like [Daphnia carinata]|uniref:lactosylceramide 4-alpha-galactosyltransferase-like n=1 Tax=Daphnia carinata TaxID=120202 RepID=UPI00257B755A|nr:lactosylceramide 4-alpha-galactosyltransferase-like [Daphnia carinata]